MEAESRVDCETPVNCTDEEEEQETDPPMEEDPLGALDPAPSMHQEDRGRFNPETGRMEPEVNPGNGHGEQNHGYQAEGRPHETELDTGEKELQELIEKTKEQSKQEQEDRVNHDRFNQDPENRDREDHGRENGNPENQDRENPESNGRDDQDEGGRDDRYEEMKGEAPKAEVDSDTNRQYSDHTDLLCLVECSICGSSMLHHLFRKHISTQHNVNVRNYTEAYGQVVFKRKVFHKCKFTDCQEDLLFSYDSICQHLKAVHELTLDLYSDKFNVFHEAAGEEGCVGLMHEFDYNSWLRDFLEFGKDGEKYFSDSLDEGCIYRCKVCTEDVLHFLFKDHLRAEHGMELGGYLAEYKEHEYTRLTHYKCRVCQADVLLAAEEICAHVWNQHQLSMEDYIAAFDAFESGFMSTNITSMVNREDILRVHHNERVDPDLVEEKIYTDNLEYSCLYRCGACRRQVSNLTFERHLKKKHAMEQEKYTEIYGPIEYTRIVYYRCKVCDTPLIFSFDDIDRHVKERHSLTLEDYEINYNAFECTDKKGDKQEVVTSSDYHIPLDDRMYSDCLDDMCLYKCTHCDKVLYHSLLLKHVEKVHQVKKEFDKFEEFDRLKVERMNYYKCKLCPAELIFTVTSINSHVKAVHNLSLQDYVSKYKGFDSNDKKYNSQPRDKDTPKRPLMVDLDDNILRKKSRRVPDGEKFVSDNPDDMCVCKCNFCGKNVLHHLLRKHVISKHPRDKDIYGEYEYVVKSYYRCKVCDNEILFSLEAIKNHVKKSHRMTLTQYKEQYQAFSEGDGQSFEHDESNEFNQDDDDVDDMKHDMSVKYDVDDDDDRDESLIPHDPDSWEKMELQSELRDLR